MRSSNPIIRDWNSKKNQKSLTIVDKSNKCSSKHLVELTRFAFMSALTFIGLFPRELTLSWKSWGCLLMLLWLFLRKKHKEWWPECAHCHCRSRYSRKCCKKSLRVCMCMCMCMCVCFDKSCEFGIEDVSIKLVDFGLACRIGDEKAPGRDQGTLEYTSPEVLHGYPCGEGYSFTPHSLSIFL